VGLGYQAGRRPSTGRPALTAEPKKTLQLTTTTLALAGRSVPLADACRDPIPKGRQKTKTVMFQHNCPGHSSLFL